MNEQAFPGESPIDGELQSGMSLRDYFAAKAMHGVLTEPQWGDGVSAINALTVERKPFQERVAIAAYLLADAMLNER